MPLSYNISVFGSYHMNTYTHYPSISENMIGEPSLNNKHENEKYPQNEPDLTIWQFSQFLDQNNLTLPFSYYTTLTCAYITCSVKKLGLHEPIRFLWIKFGRVPAIIHTIST